MMVGNVTSAAPHLPIEIVVHRWANTLALENTWSIPADGKTLCTQHLQQALDAIYKKGGVYKDIIDASARSLNIEKIARTIDEGQN